MTIIATTDRAGFLLDSAARCYANAQRPGLSLECRASWLQDSEAFVDLALRAMREASIPDWPTTPSARALEISPRTPSLGEITWVPPDGALPGFHVYLAAPLEYLDATLAAEICAHWRNLTANELFWISYTVKRTCQESRWYRGAMEDLDLLADIRRRQETGK